MFVVKFSKFSGNKQKIAKNIYWALVGKIINLACGLAVGIIVARYLGPEQYGLMNYVISFVSLFQILASFGLENIEIREESKGDYTVKSILGTAFRLRLFFSIITIILIAIVAVIYEADCKTIFLILIYSFGIIFSSFDVIRNYYTSIVKNEYIVKVGIVRNILSLLIKGGLVLTSAPLFFFILSLVFDMFITAQGYLFAYKKDEGSILNWEYDRRLARYLISQSFPLLLSASAAVIFLQINQILVGKMINMQSVGYLSIASQVVSILMFVPTIMIQTVCPILIRVKKENETEYCSKSMSFMSATVWFSFICAIILSISSYYIISLTFGEKYMPAVPVLQLLAFNVVGTSLNVISGQLLIIDNKQKLFILRSVSGAVFCIIGNILLIPMYGITGVVWITIFTQLIAGWVIHLFIPQYKYMFWMQFKSVIYGWRYIPKLWKK